MKYVAKLDTTKTMPPYTRDPSMKIIMSKPDMAIAGGIVTIAHASTSSTAPEGTITGAHRMQRQTSAPAIWGDKEAVAGELRNGKHDS
jgi:hypothetical protein